MYKDEIIEIYRETKTLKDTHMIINQKYNINLSYESFRYYIKSRKVLENFFGDVAKIKPF